MNKTELEARYDALQEKLTKANDAFKADDLRAYLDYTNAAKEAAKKYNTQKELSVFSAFKATDNPVKSAIVSPTYQIYAVSEEREDSVVVGIKAVAKDTKVNLASLFKYLGKKNTWKSLIAQYAQVMRIRVANDMGISKRTLAMEYGLSYNMEDVYRGLENFQKDPDHNLNPISSNQMAKRLQEIIDQVYFEDNGSGKNKYMLNTADVKYLLYAYTKTTNDAVSAIKLVSDKAVENQIIDILHKQVCGINYKLIFKEKATKDEKLIVTKYDVDAVAKKAPVAEAPAPVAAPAPAPEKKKANKKKSA